MDCNVVCKLNMVDATYLAIGMHLKSRCSLSLQTLYQYHLHISLLSNLIRGSIWLDR